MSDEYSNTLLLVSAGFDLYDSLGSWIPYLIAELK